MDVRKADPGFQRLVALLVAAGTCAGVLLIGLLEQYRGPLADWVRADAGQSAQRVQLLLAGFAVLLLAPLVAMAAYLSSLGGRAVVTGEYPPPGYRVVRDTTIVGGSVAIARGRTLQGVAVFLCGAAVIVGLLLWRLASLFSARMG